MTTEVMKRVVGDPFTTSSCFLSDYAKDDNIDFSST